MPKLSKMAKSMARGFRGPSIFVFSRAAEPAAISEWICKQSYAGHYPTKHKWARMARPELGWGIISTSASGYASLMLARAMLQMEVVPDNIDKLLCLGASAEVERDAARYALEHVSVLYDDCDRFSEAPDIDSSSRADGLFRYLGGGSTARSDDDLCSLWEYTGPIPTDFAARHVMECWASHFSYGGFAWALAEDLGLKTWAKKQNEKVLSEKLSVKLGTMSRGMLELPGELDELMGCEFYPDLRSGTCAMCKLETRTAGALSATSSDIKNFYIKTTAIGRIWQECCRRCGFSYLDQEKLPSDAVLDAIAAETGADKMLKAVLVDGCDVNDVLASC